MLMDLHERQSIELDAILKNIFISPFVSACPQDALAPL